MSEERKEWPESDICPRCGLLDWQSARDLSHTYCGACGYRATPTPARSEAAGGEDVALRIRAEQAEKERQYWIAQCREKDQQLLVEQGRVVTLERVARAKEEANESLRQQLAAAREDAERYRFLRDNPLGFRAVDGAASVPPHPTVMDRWVDAARAEAGRETEGGR